MGKIFDYIDGVYEGADKRYRREKQWVAIVIHHTGAGSTGVPVWKKFFKNISAWMAKKDNVYASAHFHIAREGADSNDRYALVDQIVDPRIYEAFHAGKSKWYHPILKKIVPDWNRYSIGIELNGDGNKYPYSLAQMRTLAKIIVDLSIVFPTIDIKNGKTGLPGHEDIAPDRKVDPGKFFDRELLEGLIQEELAMKQ